MRTHTGERPFACTFPGAAPRRARRAPPRPAGESGLLLGGGGIALGAGRGVGPAAAAKGGGGEGSSARRPPDRL